MKTTLKTLVAVLLLAISPMTAAAQDTVYSTSLPPDNYFIYAWTNFDSTAKHGWFTGVSDGAISNSISFYTPDTLEIYGIVAAMSSLDMRYDSLELIGAATSHWVYDTYGEDAFEYLRLYEAEPDSLRQLGEDLKVQPNRDRPDYYLNTGLSQAMDLTRTWFEPIDIMPVFERYFATPQIVADSFYLGMTCQTVQKFFDSTGIEWLQKSWTTYIHTLREDPEQPMKPAGRHQRINGGPTVGWYYHTKLTEYPIFFPILTPNPNSTDTTGIEVRRLEERLVGVMPNPATGQVKVVSSFGMTHFDVYDAAGRRVLSRDVQGLQASFDVAAWPRGAYTVHVLTPAGTTVKKLLVE